MITRIFRVRIVPAFRAEFERAFREVSVPLVEGKEGYLSHVVGYPTKWKPDDYLLLTNWTGEDALVRFAGDDWKRAVIPPGMESFVADCWVDHFQTQA